MKKKEIEIGISLDTMLELLTSMKLVTEVDHVEITIYNPEIYRISEDKDLATMVKWRKLIKELSKLKELNKQMKEEKKLDNLTKSLILNDVFNNGYSSIEDRNYREVNIGNGLVQVWEGKQLLATMHKKILKKLKSHI